MSMTFAPLPLTDENLYFQGVWTRMFASFIQSGRDKAGLSIEQTAELAGMSVEDWTGMEVGTWLPSTHRQFRSIAAALDLDWATMSRIVLLCSRAWGIQ